MSKVAEVYYENRHKAYLNERGIELLKDMSEMSEKEKCLYYGIACSYGICDECELTERS